MNGIFGYSFCVPEHKDVYIVFGIVYNFDAIMVIEQNLTNCWVVSSVELEKRKM